jgi:hypothetical protein
VEADNVFDRGAIDQGGSEEAASAPRVRIAALVEKGSTFCKSGSVQRNHSLQQKAH